MRPRSTRPARDGQTKWRLILHRLPTLLREAFDYPYREIANVLAQAMVYVLEGSIVMQAKGKAPVTLAPGQVLT